MFCTKNKKRLCLTVPKSTYIMNLSISFGKSNDKGETMKKFLSIALAILLVVSAAPYTLLADTNKNIVASGTEHEVTWTLDSDGKLTVSGQGAMPEPEEDYRYGWAEYSKRITEIVVEQGVRNIGHHAFEEYDKLKKVTIPASVVYIGKRAFDGCGELTDVTVSDGVRTIGDYAFFCCYNLEEITIPDSVTAIGESAFGSCLSLERIVISDGVTDIGADAFFGTAYDRNESNWDGGVLYLHTYLLNARLERVSGAYRIKDGTTLIANHAFYSCTDLTEIGIPGSVTRIGENAFERCARLTEVVIPDGVLQIGKSAFDGCTMLANITLPAGIEEIGAHAFEDTAFYRDEQNWENDVLYLQSCLLTANGYISGAYGVKDGTTLIADDAFCNCTELTGISIPGSVTNIGESAFYGCIGLTEVVIPDGVRSILDYAFYDCEQLERITVPDSVMLMGMNVFVDTAYYNDERNWENHALYVDGILVAAKNKSISGCYRIKEGTALIANGAFYKCAELTEILIPDSMKSIGWGAFIHCTGLTSVTIPDSVEQIGESAFYNCTGLTDVTIPDSVTKIGDDAFKSCENLTICGTKGSCAEEYANRNQIPFREVISESNTSNDNGNASNSNTPNSVFPTWAIVLLVAAAGAAVVIAVALLLKKKAKSHSADSAG